MNVTIHNVTPQKSLAQSQAEPDDKVHEFLGDRIRQLEAELERSGKAEQKWVLPMSSLFTSLREAEGPHRK